MDLVVVEMANCSYSVDQEKAFSFFYNIFRATYHYLNSSCLILSNDTHTATNSTTEYFDWDEQNFGLDNQAGDESIKYRIIFKFIVEGLLVTLLTFCGLIGNILSVFVLTKKKMRSKSINLLLLGLAISDTIFIFCAMFVFGILNICTYFNVDVTQSYLGCILPISFPVGFTALTCSVYFTIAVTLERYIAVTAPLNCRTYCTRQNAKICFAGILLFAILYNIPRWLEYNYIRVTSPGKSHSVIVRYITITTSFRRNLMYDKYYVLIGFSTIVFVVPIVVLLVLNISIYRNVKLANENRKNLSKSQQSENSLAFMLIIIVSIFIFCNSISVLDSLIKSIYKARNPDLEILRNFLVIFNSSINFFIYCAYGKTFRAMFLEMWRCWCKQMPCFCISCCNGNKQIMNMTSINNSLIRKRSVNNKVRDANKVELEQVYQNDDNKSNRAKMGNHDSVEIQIEVLDQ